MTYGKRFAACGNTTNLVIEHFEYSESTGEERTRYAWVCELGLPAAAIRDLPCMGCELSRGMLSAQSARDALVELARGLGRNVVVKRSGVLLAGRINEDVDG